MTRKELLQRLHRKSPRTLYEWAAAISLFFAMMAVSLVAWHDGWWPVTLICWVVQAHIGHANLLAFHEASHHALHPDSLVNELQGVFLGSLIFTPLSAFRWVHNQHHLHLASRDDAELWPFVNPQTPRWQRLLAAVGELLFGFFYSPLIFLRGVLLAPKMPRDTARRLVLEYALCVALWTTIVVIVIYFHMLPEFIVGYLIPAILAGNLQSLRKFTEHMGLLGNDVPSTTRTVIDPSLTGRVLSATMLHIDLHGPHHLYPKIPHFSLPNATPIAYESEIADPVAANIFPSYFAAIRSMVQTLTNPRVGSQWLETATHPSK